MILDWVINISYHLLSTKGVPGTQRSKDHEQCHFIFIIIPELRIPISSLNLRKLGQRIAVGPVASVWLAIRLQFQVSQTSNSGRDNVNLKWCIVGAYEMPVLSLSMCFLWRWSWFLRWIFTYSVLQTLGLSYCPPVVHLDNSDWGGDLIEV